MIRKWLKKFIIKHLLVYNEPRDYPGQIRPRPIWVEDGKWMTCPEYKDKDTGGGGTGPY